MGQGGYFFNKIGHKLPFKMSDTATLDIAYSIRNIVYA